MHQLSFRHITLYLVAIATLLSLCSSRVYGHILFNLAQVERIHGIAELDLYFQAIVTQPKNPFFRWQTGKILASQGDLQSAAKVLLPLLNQHPIASEQFQTLGFVFNATGQSKLLFDLYVTTSKPLLLQSQIAAVLLKEHLAQKKTISPDNLKLLISQALVLAPTTPAFQLLSEQLSSQNFWLTQTGQYLQSTLAWRVRMGLASSSNFRSPKNSVRLSENDSQNIAKLIGTPKDTLEIGPELANNGNFEQITCRSMILSPAPTIPAEPCDLPSWLPTYMNTGNPWNRATFVMGIDSDPSSPIRQAIRIDGLVIERNSDLESARVGIWHTPIMLKPKVPYLISFVYRTQNVKKLAAALWLSAVPIFFSGDHFFSPTDNVWKRVNIIGWNQSNVEESIQPLLRSFSEGTVWFGDFSIRQLVLKTPIERREIIIDIHNVE